MTNVDILILVTILGSMIAGYMAGLVRTVSLFAFLVLGLLLAFQYETYILQWLRFNLKLSIQTSYYITYFGLMAISVGIGLFIASKITRLLKFVFLNWLNKITGALAGGGVMVIIWCVVLNLVMLFPSGKPYLPKEMQDKSLLVKPIASIFRGEMEVENIDTYVKKRSSQSPQSREE